MKVKQSEPDWVEAVSRNAKVDRRGTRRGGATAGGSAGTRVRAIDRQEPPSPHLDAINHSCCALPVGSMMVARKATTKPCGGRERSGSVITALTQAKREATVRMKVADRGRSPCRRSMSITSNCDAFSVTPPHCFVGRPSRTPPRRGFYGTLSMTTTNRSLRRIVRRSCVRPLNSGAYLHCGLRTHLTSWCWARTSTHRRWGRGAARSDMLREPG